MAGTAGELSRHRAAVLLRCQQAREQRRQRDALRAELDSNAAAAAERSAREAASSGKAAGADRLRQVCDALGGKTVRAEQLATLPALKQALAREAEEQDQAVVVAAEAARVARGSADAAHQALLAERRATEKRSKLIERAQIIWRRRVDLAEELERDEQVADTWRPV